MRLDVCFTPAEVAPSDLAGRTVVVVDILRASSTIVQALSAGAKAIYPVGSIEDALRLAKTFGREEVLLCGERKCLRIEGFDLGNSPSEFTRERVAGKILVMTTTNGTAAMGQTGGASRVLIGSLLNLGAIVSELVRLQADPVVICSGRERSFALEDAAFAGLVALHVMHSRTGDWVMNDAARASVALAREFGVGADLFRASVGGRAIIDAGLEDDIAFCAQRDLHDVLPVLHDRSITLAPAPVNS